MRAMAQSLLALTLLQASGQAELIEVQFKGAITSVDPGTPYEFALTDRVEGRYVFSTASPAVERSFMGVQYAAVRLFEIGTSRGFYGHINYGTVMLGTATGGMQYHIPPTEYLVLTLPPLVESPGIPFPSGPSAIPGVEDAYNPRVEFDFTAAAAAAEEAAALGFGGPSGAFADGPWPTVSLKLEFPIALPGSGLSATPPKLSQASDAIGVIQFGTPLDVSGPRAVFSITQFTVVPEPTTTAMCVTMAAAYGFQASRRREGRTDHEPPRLSLH